MYCLQAVVTVLVVDSFIHCMGTLAVVKLDCSDLPGKKEVEGFKTGVNL